MGVSYAGRPALWLRFGYAVSVDAVVYRQHRPEDELRAALPLVRIPTLEFPRRGW